MVIHKKNDLYFYHSDHHGSSSFITNVSGNVNQPPIAIGVQYLPFGESFINQQTNHSIRYTFSAKEKDSETNFSYFGARYYASDFSVWLSVDPLSDKHPDYSPFAYCFNNPMNFIDPLGLDTILFNKQGEFGKPIPGKDGDNDVYVKSNSKEFEENKINYNKKGKLRKRHNNKEIDKSFRESMSYDEEYNTHSYNVSDYSTAKDIFEFFSDNTKVEWGHVVMKDLNSGEIKNDIRTSHAEEIIWFNISSNGKFGDFTIIDVRHSHQKSLYSDQADRNLHKALNSNGNNVPTSKYFLGRYYPFNSEKNPKYENFPFTPKTY